MKSIFLFVGFCSASWVNRPEYSLVEDNIDEELTPEDKLPQVLHVFEDFNTNSLERQITKKKLKDRFQNFLMKHSSQTNQMLGDKELSEEIIGNFILNLYGDNFSKFDLALKDITIAVKAYIEEELNLLFLYRCSNRYFGDKDRFKVCSRLNRDIKDYLMFENFFDLGWQNWLESKLEEEKTEPEFQEAMLHAIEKIRLDWKLFMNLVDFTQKNFKETVKRKIHERFGAGFDVIVNIHPDPSEVEPIEELNQDPQEVVADNGEEPDQLELEVEDEEDDDDSEENAEEQNENSAANITENFEPSHVSDSALKK